MDGNASDSIVQRTDVSGPSPPTILNLTCTGENSLYLKWRIPETYYNSIDYYIISYRNIETSIFKDIQIDNASSSHSEIGVSKCQLWVKGRKLSEINFFADDFAKSNVQLDIRGQSESCFNKYHKFKAIDPRKLLTSS